MNPGTVAEKLRQAESEAVKWEARQRSTEQKLGYEEKLRGQAEAGLAAITRESTNDEVLVEEYRSALAAAREEARHMQGDALVIREVAERITKEGTDAPLDPLWLYERMCEVIEVIDSGYLLARYQPEEES